ncbi:MAG: hypothetical protein ACK4RX_03755 [Chitinophagaceae bacterium]
MVGNQVDNKLIHVLIEISKAKRGEENLIEILEHSILKFERHWNYEAFPNAYNLEILITPNIYAKNYHLKDVYTDLIKHRINDSSPLIIDKLKLLPDYDKLEIINSKVFSIITEWEEINELQYKLLESIKTSKTSIDFQNIGLISRTIMEKLASIVFDVNKHKPQKSEVSVKEGKFKNQLHTYIDTVLSGSQNQEFRKLAESAIDLVEDSIDFMNKTTHKLDASKHLAEVCIVSTITAISIIKLVSQLE